MNCRLDIAGSNDESSTLAHLASSLASRIVTRFACNAMPGINLSPRRALAYPSTRLTFVDESSFAYCFGSAVRITHILPDKGDGDGQFLWEENEWAGMSAVAANWRAGRLAVCPAGHINPAIHLYSYPETRLQGILHGGTNLRFIDVAFSRDGSRVAAFGNHTDHLATVWNVKKPPTDEREHIGEKIVEAVLPGDMSFLSFNPGDSDQLCIGGASGLYFWRVDNLVDKWVIVPIKARTPAPQGKGKDHPLGDYLDNEGNPNSVNGHIGNIHPAHTNGIVVDVPDGEETAQSYLPSPHGGEVSRLEVTDTTRDIPAAELLHLESLVTMGDGQHDSFTCHCWGLEARVWAVNEPGQLVCFDANTGKCSSCTTLTRVSESSDKDWKAVGLMLTKTHIIIVGSDGSMEWMALPTDPGGELQVECSIQLTTNGNASCPVVTTAFNPLYDKMVVGCADGSLHSVFMDIERHTKESGVPPSGVNVLKTFHARNVVALACLRPASPEDGDVPAGILVTAGEDGTIRAWTTDRGKVCGIRKFFLCSNSAATSDYDVEGPSEGILPDPKHETMGVQEAEFPRRGDVPIPLSSLASCRSQSLLAASTYSVDMSSLWHEHFYHGPASQLCFHPTKSLLAVASAEDRTVYVVNFHNSTGEFVVCGVGTAPSGKGGVNGLMWRGTDIVFSTDDCLLCSFPAKSERQAHPNCPDPLSWVFRTPTPLHGMQPHPQIEQGPFFAVSSDMRVLQVLPALPEKGAPFSVDGGEPKSLFPLDTLEAHQKGAAVMAASPDGRFMATGGTDGLVCLWMVYENQVELLNSALVHAGPVISLAFTTDSAQLFTTSLDGTVFGLALEGLQEDSGSQPPPAVTSLEGLAGKRVAKDKNRKSTRMYLGSQPWRQEMSVETRNNTGNNSDPARKAQQKVVGEFKARLARIITRNETLPELEKMGRDEIVMDLAGRSRKVAANETTANRLREEIRRRNLAKELVRARIKTECWDSMEIKKKEVWCMQREGVFAENFAIRQRSPEEVELVRKIPQLADDEEERMHDDEDDN